MTPRVNAKVLGTNLKEVLALSMCWGQPKFQFNIWKNQSNHSQVCVYSNQLAVEAIVDSTQKDDQLFVTTFWLFHQTKQFGRYLANMTTHTQIYGYKKVIVLSHSVMSCTICFSMLSKIDPCRGDRKKKWRKRICVIVHVVCIPKYVLHPPN